MAWSIQTPVAGVTHEGRQDVLARMAAKGDKPGKATLKRNPLNPYDSNAVEVYNDCGEMAGFLPGDLVEFFSALVDAGRPISARFQSVAYHAEYNRYSATLWITVNQKAGRRQAAKPAESKPAQAPAILIQQEPATLQDLPADW